MGSRVRTPGEEIDSSVAWLSDEKHTPIRIKTAVCIGRAPTCDIVLCDPKVSRRHAVINPSARSEFWISDIGGCNGVLVNEHRIRGSQMLRHGDRIRISKFSFQFFCPGAPRSTLHAEESDHTLPCCSVENRWLLVADLMDGTRWASAMDLNDYPRRLDQWLRKCRRAVESNHGSMNNYVGDGFLAGWLDGPDTGDHLCRALVALRELQTSDDVLFRFVLHYGEITASGVGTVGEESLLGPEVNYVFRIEKVAARNGLQTLISEAARQRLNTCLELEPTPPLDVPSFGPNHMFFTFPNPIEAADGPPPTGA